MRGYKSGSHSVLSPHPNPLPEGEGTFATSSGERELTGQQCIFPCFSMDSVAIIKEVSGILE